MSEPPSARGIGVVFSRGTGVASSRGIGVVFSYGFRPFFLLAAAWAPIALVALFLGLRGAAWPADALPLFRWHGHEMLFGFVAAAIAGFLLTAAPTWTGTRAISGAPLAALAALWIAGRVVASPLTGLHSTPAVLVDLLFFPSLAAALAPPLIRTRNVRNYPFLVMLGLLFVADLLFHAVALGWVGALPFDPLRFAANLVLVMVVVVGGRIVPAFTRNALVRAGRGSSIAPAPLLERASLVAVAAVVVGDLVVPGTFAAGLVAAIAAVLLGARLARWEGLRAVRMPIVFVLHVGYAWLVVALALKAVWLTSMSPWAANWLHAQTAGAFGTMILAVTTRVALGHTGRPLVVHPAITAAYGLVVLGALVRVLGPAVLPISTLHALGCAMLLWAGAFVVFLGVYVPILLGPRADGA
ncbi:MAG TPA: NnrS family protein [Gammaproteobacteria bacterium]